MSREVELQEQVDDLREQLWRQRAAYTALKDILSVKGCPGVNIEAVDEKVRVWVTLGDRA